jgi:hypothetical protein
VVICLKDETIIKLARTVGGIALLGIHAFTDINGSIIAAAFFLLGVPFELAKAKKEDSD